MPRPKILDVNEGVGEVLFYPYNVQVNKCSGSCNTLDNPMAKLCVPSIVKRVNMQAYNFLIRLNETRKLNSLECNNKQIWNDDTCRCDCNEDFSGIEDFAIVLKDTRGIQVLANVNVICGVKQVNI